MSQLKYRLLASDIDGTLISSNSSLHPETIKSIHEYRQAGGLFTLATGRNFLHTKDLIEKLQIDIPVILSDGAILYDPIEKKKQILSSFQWEQLQWITQHIQEIHSEIDQFVFSYHPETDDQRIYGTVDHPLIHQYAQDWYYHTTRVSSFEEIDYQTHLIHIFVFLKNEKVIPLFQTWSQQHLKNYIVQFWSKNFVCISPKGTEKGSAIHLLCKQLQLSVNEVAAIGDHLNDLSMSKTVGLFAAMKNGKSQLKQAAQLVVPSNDEHGVAYFIRNYLFSPSQ